MDAKLTYISLLSFAACLVSSCSTDAPDKVDVSKGSELTFDVSDFSRATVTSAINKFAVFGDKMFPVDASADPSVIFDNTEVVRNTDTGLWSYGEPQYWYPKHEYSFVAIHPLSALSAGNNPIYLNSRLSFTYRLPVSDGMITKSDVTDIISATHRRLSGDSGADSMITFRFGHIMSLINLAPALADNTMGADEYILIRKLELSGFNTEGKFTILPASMQSNAQTDDRVVEITGQQGNGTLTVEFAEPVKITNGRDNVRLFDDDDAIIMLPQAFASDSEAKVILSYTANTSLTVKQVILSLSNQKWESGKSYNYRFTMDRKGPVYGTTTITDWAEMNVGNIDAH